MQTICLNQSLTSLQGADRGLPSNPIIYTPLDVDQPLAYLVFVYFDSLMISCSPCYSKVSTLHYPTEFV